MFQAHELMSPVELGQVFQVGAGEEVPEYEVVTIHHRQRHRRSADTLPVHQVHLQYLHTLVMMIPCGY